jgi:hypothetical protein
VKSGSTYAFSCSEFPVPNKLDQQNQSSKENDIEMLRKKKEELLKLQQYVAQSLKDIHSKLNRTEEQEEKEKTRNRSSVKTITAKARKESTIKKSKAKKSSSKAVICNFSSKQDSEPPYPLNKVSRKTLKTFKITSEALKRSRKLKKTPSKATVKNSVMDNPKKSLQNSHFEEKKFSIMTSFDHSISHKLESVSQSRQVTPAYKDRKEIDKSVESRDVSSQRRDRSTRNLQRKERESTVSQEMGTRNVTPEMSRNAFNR